MNTLKGGDSTAVLVAGLPNITGTFGRAATDSYPIFDAVNVESGAFTVKRDTKCGFAQNTDNLLRPTYINFDASKSNSIYGSSNTVQPASITLIPQIKF